MSTKVVISPGYGAGISTWDDIDPTDPKLVKIVENGRNEDEFKLAFPNVYSGGLLQAVVVEVPTGHYFRVVEYDGNEVLETFVTPEEIGYCKAT